MQSVHDKIQTRRYGCHECREDAELVMSERATSAARTLYHEHIRECRDCRRMHRLLYALYEGPVVPLPPSGVREEKEFLAALRRAREATPDPWYHKLSIRAGVTALAASAAVLALALFDLTPDLSDLQPLAALDAPAAEDSVDVPVLDPTSGSLATTGGIDHPAQSYGRVVGGHAVVTTPEGQASTTDTFPVHTRFSVPPTDSLQVGVMGKIVANFTPGSQIEWTAASRNLVEIEVERGIAAVRYDRRPSDPILQIRTPSAIVRVIGTVFTVEVDEQDNTAVSVLRGQVEVLHAESNRLLAEVESGNVYDVARASFSDVGKVEVAAALPLSNEVEVSASTDPAEFGGLADGHIPTSWHVPGLSDEPGQRTLSNVPARDGRLAVFDVDRVVTRSPGSLAAVVEEIVAVAEEDDELPVPVRSSSVRNDGDDLLERLVADAEMTRKKELKAALHTCRTLFSSPTKRYRAAKCLSDFITEYGDDPAAVEGYLLVGMLRHDYAFDYRAAEKAFETFLRRAPGDHPSAEFAHYRMWLSATEDGRISQALERGRKYLERYPNGKYVGKLLQRFPELKSAL